ncbi:type VI secretion system baseplate subunit TssG [Litoreibacter albidus]|uniref:type VI secretion system baseplate subunit TssG n=1 Tax=Litoreibacter albidus TaxID=670155 RepID=UPI003735040C
MTKIPAKKKPEMIGPPAPTLTSADLQGMSRRAMLKATPWRFGFLAALREMERTYPDKPRIGQNATIKEEIVSLGQDPFLDFPASNITAFEEKPGGKPARLNSKFLGFYGPQGALPLNTTAEVHGWLNARDPSFARFTDIFANRFLQLFYRAWADARPIAQFDHPTGDRFQAYVGSLAGLGTPAFKDRDHIPDVAKLPLVALFSGRIKSAVRLRQMLELLLKVHVDIEEHVPSWMSFEPQDLTKIGLGGSHLGQNVHLGSRVPAVNEKICIHVRTESLEQYRSYLPGGDSFTRLTDIVVWYLGVTIEVDVSLSLPADQVPAAQLGQQTALGWTGWIKPETPDDTEPRRYVQAAQFSTERAPAKAAA